MFSYTVVFCVCTAQRLSSNCFILPSRCFIFFFKSPFFLSAELVQNNQGLPKDLKFDKERWKKKIQELTAFTSSVHTNIAFIFKEFL